MATYIELREQDFKRQIEFNNIKKYHEAGFKGKDITVLNAESDTDHRLMTSKAFKDYAPEATLLESAISVRTSGDKVLEVKVNLNGEKLNLDDAIDRYNIKIITRSFAGSTPKTTLNYYKDLQKRKGVIFVNSAGNEPYENGVWSKDNTAITVSACQLKEDGRIVISYFGSEGEVDFTCFMAKGIGTSASAPALAAIIALLLQRYGDFNQEECVEILKSIALDLGDHIKFGWGLPILPLADEIKIIKGADKVDFKDVDETRWSKPAIDRCVEEGLLLGFEDGTFRPTEHVTREQFAQILVRVLDKIK